MTVKARVAILISGRGSNMKSLIQAARSPEYPAEIIGVFSNRADAAGLGFANSAQIRTCVISHKDHDNRDAYCRELDALFQKWRADLLVHAGYMRIHSDEFVRKWLGRMLNIHPSLLPAFKGLNPQQQALDAGVKLSGATVHELTTELDAGRPVMQAAVPVLDTDDAHSLAARILEIENRIYPVALRRFVENRDNADHRRASGAHFCWPCEQ